MDISQIHANNAAWWNENAPWYAERDADEEIAFFKEGGSYLFESEKELLGDISPWCRRAIHLQCSHGRDALSLLRQGAHEVVGVDISEHLLAVARLKAEALGAPATFFLADVLETPHDLDGTADLVYTGKGALCWMMDLDAWARVVARLLKDGGLFFIHESHPLDWVWNVETPEYRLDPEHGDYFSERPNHHLFAAHPVTRPEYRQWTLAQIVNSLIRSGLRIERLEEYPEPFWPQFPHIPEDTLRRLPHAFALMARKFT